MEYNNNKRLGEGEGERNTITERKFARASTCLVGIEARSRAKSQRAAWRERRRREWRGSRAKAKGKGS